MLGPSVQSTVEQEIREFSSSRLADLVSTYGEYAIKFVESKWAAVYESPRPLKVSETPALTWGTIFCNASTPFFATLTTETPASSRRALLMACRYRAESSTISSRVAGAN